MAHAMAQIPALPRTSPCSTSGCPRQRDRTVPRPALQDARPALPDADVVHSREAMLDAILLAPADTSSKDIRAWSWPGPSDVGAGRSLLNPTGPRPLDG